MSTSGDIQETREGGGKSGGMTLSELWQEVAELVKEGEEGVTGEKKYQEQIQTALEKLTTLRKAITMLSLFSENEIIDEMNTSYIKFILVEYYTGKLLLLINGQTDRLLRLNQAKNHLTSFLSICSDYALASNETEALLKGKPVNKLLVSRDERIAQFRREKEIQASLQALNSKLAAYGKDAEEDDELDGVQRDLYLTLIEFYQLKSLQELNSIHQEQEIFKSMPPPDQRAGESEDTDQITWRLDRLPLDGSSGSGLLDSNGKPTRPFVITSRQKELRDQVFRPGWRLPTMTIDEYLAIEMERGNVLQGGGERPTKPHEDLDDDMDALDAATMKQRAWDEFTDHNPRGSGNRGNKG